MFAQTLKYTYIMYMYTYNIYLCFKYVIYLGPERQPNGLEQIICM